MTNRPPPFGRGASAMTGDPPLRDQLDPYLKRLRRTVPFPCTAEEAYFGCMPVIMRRLFDEGAFDPLKGKSARVHNFVQCLSSSADQGPPTAPGRNAILAAVHINVEENVFWMYAPENVPVPVYRAGNPFDLPLDHPKRDELIKWIASSMKVEDGIQTVFGAIAKLEGRAKSGAEIASAWPELLNFIKYRRIMPALPAAHARKLHAEVEREIPPTVKRFVTEMLATCVMLPERNQPLTGWVNYYVEGL